MIGAQSDSIGTDVGGSESVAGDESEIPVTQIPLEVGSVCGSNTTESAASMAGLSFPSSDGAICSGCRARTVAGSIS